MEKINNFRGLLLYVDSTGYTDENIQNIIKNAPDISDYIILDVISDAPVASDVLKLAKNIYKYKKTARIWIGTCKYTSEGTAHPDFNKIQSNLVTIKNKFISDSTGKIIWNKCVKGIYLNMEAIYDDIDYAVSLDKNTGKSFLVAKKTADYVHNDLGLNFLWIPYYGYGENTIKVIKDIAYMVACTDIFDLVIIQPHYYFGDNYTNDDVLIKNLNGIKFSIEKNNICYRDGVEVFSRSYSRAKIGFEMEFDRLNLDSNKYNKEEKRARYEKYVQIFKTFRNCTDVPICYYAGGISSITKGYLYLLIEDFYGISYGDADKDGVLTANDSSLVLDYSNSNNTPDELIRVCDVDGDEMIGANDASLILQKSLNDFFDFPVLDKVYGNAKN